MFVIKVKLFHAVLKQELSFVFVFGSIIHDPLMLDVKAMSDVTWYVSIISHTHGEAIRHINIRGCIGNITQNFSLQDCEKWKFLPHC